MAAFAFIILALLYHPIASQPFNQCKIAFRLDGVQEFDRVSTQNAIMSAFDDAGVALTISVITSRFGLVDPPSPLISGIQNLINSGATLEVASNTVNHTLLSGQTLDQQIQTLNESKILLESTLQMGRRVTTLVPPFNLYDQDTLTALRQLEYNAISAAFEPNTCQSCDGHNFYLSLSDVGLVMNISHQPATAFTSTNPGNGTLFDNSKVMDDINASLVSYNYAVISLSYFEYSTADLGINTTAINQLSDLLANVKSTFNCDTKVIQDMLLPVGVTTPLLPIPPPAPTPTSTPTPSDPTEPSSPPIQPPGPPSPSPKSGPGTPSTTTTEIPGDSRTSSSTGLSSLRLSSTCLVLSLLAFVYL